MTAQLAAVETCDRPEMPDVDSSSEQYARRFAGPAGEYLLGVQTRIVLDLLRPWPGATVLDVGGGHGQTALPLARAGYGVTVLGSHESALTRLGRLAPGIPTIVGELCDPPLADHSFDIALAFRMMPHVRDWRRFAAALCRIARQAVIVDFPTPGSINLLAPMFFDAKKRLEGDTRHFQMMPRRDVREAFAQYGFSSTTERPQFFFPMVVHRSLNRPGLSRVLESAAAAAGLTQRAGSPVILRAARGPLEPSCT